MEETKTITVSGPQRLALLQHAGQAQVNGHGEALVLRRLFKDLELLDAYERMVAGVPVMADEFKASGAYALTAQSRKFLRDRFLGGPMSGAVALTVAPLVEALGD